MECSEQVIGHRGMCRTHDEGPSVVLAVLVLVEDVHDGGHEGIEEGEDRYGDKELCRGGVVSRQEKALAPHFFAQRGFKGHLVQPDTHRGGPRGSRSSSFHTTACLQNVIRTNVISIWAICVS